MNKDNKKIVFDIGGNGVQYQINNEKIKSFSTINKNKEFVLKEIAMLINESGAKSVGIASPCGVNSETGFLKGISGIKNYGNFNLYDELKAMMVNDVKLIAHNDANAALLGNLIGEEYSSAVQVTIGTGIGGAVFLNGKIFHGHSGMAGEFGYPPFIEAMNTSESCSANALLRMINENNNTSYKNIKEIGDITEYRDTVIKWSNNVAKIISNIFFYFDPGVILISGGVINNQDIKKYIKQSIKYLHEKFKYNFEINIKFKNIINPALKGLKSII